MKEPLKIIGKVRARLLDETGRCKLEVILRNLITTLGKEAIAQNFFNDGTPPTLPTHIAVGSSATAPAVGDTALGGELTRLAFTSSSRSGAIVTYSVTFGAGVGTGTIEELGLLNAAAAGTLYARFLSGTFDKGANDTLAITWDLQFT